MTDPTAPPWAAELAERLDRIEAALHLGGKPRFLPLEQAARALGLKSTRALRARISRGTIPPQFVHSGTGPSGQRTDLRVDVDGYLGRR
jgi:hypothetical protein